MIKINSAAGTDNINVPAVPLTRFKKYAKYGFVLTEAQTCYCPNCKEQLNAGPDYMPETCEACGQVLDWDGYTWRKDKFIKYVDKGDRSEVDDWTVLD